MDPVIPRLEELARTDAVAAPIAILTAEVLRSLESPIWSAAVPQFDSTGLRDGRPLLAGTTISLDPTPVRELLGTLSVLACSGVAGASMKIDVLPDATTLLEASLNQDVESLASLAAETGEGQGLLSTLGQLLALPLLMACGESASTVLRDVTWPDGYCPVCGAWPTLAEVRGEEREKWLRCGRCGSAWRRPHFVCVYCGNDDHASQGYLASELSMESRRATTCERCHGYLKSISTLLPQEPSEVLLKDLSTLELDAAALERGYGRPARALALGVRVERT